MQGILDERDSLKFPSIYSVARIRQKHFHITFSLNLCKDARPILHRAKFDLVSGDSLQCYECTSAVSMQACEKNQTITTCPALLANPNCFTVASKVSGVNIYIKSCTDSSLCKTSLACPGASSCTVSQSRLITVVVANYNLHAFLQETAQ